MNLGHEIGFTRIILLHQLLMRSAVYSTDFVTNLALSDTRTISKFLKKSLKLKVPSGNLTWLWKIAHLQLICLLKMVIFHSYVKLPEGNNNGFSMFRH